METWDSSWDDYGYCELVRVRGHIYMAFGQAESREVGTSEEERAGRGREDG